MWLHKISFIGIPTLLVIGTTTAYAQEKDMSKIIITIFTDDNIRGLKPNDADVNLREYDLKKLVNFYIEEYPVYKNTSGRNRCC